MLKPAPENIKIQPPRIPGLLREASSLYDPDNTLRGLRLEMLRPSGDFAGLDAGGCLLERCVLTDCTLCGAVFSDTCFINCDLSGAALSGASFVRCEFKDCKAVGTRLTESYFHHASLSDCNFSYSNLDGASFCRLLLKNSSLRGANLATCRLKEFSSGNTDFTEASFFGTPLAGIDLRAACLDRLILQGPELSGAIVTEAQAAQLARFLGLIIR